MLSFTLEPYSRIKSTFNLKLDSRVLLEEKNDKECIWNVFGMYLEPLGNIHILHQQGMRVYFKFVESTSLLTNIENAQMRILGSFGTFSN